MLKISFKSLEALIIYFEKNITKEIVEINASKLYLVERVN